MNTIINSEEGWTGGVGGLLFVNCVLIFSTSFFWWYSITHFQLFDIVALSYKCFNHKFVQQIEDSYKYNKCDIALKRRRQRLWWKKITTKFHRSEIGIPNSRKREILLVLVLLMNTVDPLHKLNRWWVSRRKDQDNGNQPFFITLSLSL